MNRFKACLIAIDQLFNTILGGWPDETLSSRIWRNVSVPHPKKRWKWALWAVNHLFFWQRNHCKGAFDSERRRRHQPPSLRDHRSRPRQGDVIN